jgi:uncharacterized protein (DUF58 family)
MRPTLRCVLVITAGLPLSLTAATISAHLWPTWLAFIGAVVLAAGLDALLALPRRRMRVEVTMPEALYIGDQDDLVIDLSAPGWTRPMDVDVLVDLDDDLVQQPSQRVALAPGASSQPGESGQPGAAPAGEARTRATVPLVPKRRGEMGVERVWLRWRGPFGLMRMESVHEIDRRVAVAPNVRAVRAAALRFFSQRDFLSGLKVERYIGDGSEFESLREYVPGLDHRAIDWKASARHVKLLCQEFRAERNHQVVIAVDTGQLMCEPLGGVPKVDHAINAGLMLGYFCLRTGDRVGLFGFDAWVRCFVEPLGGVHSFARLERQSAGLEYQHQETNFTLGLAELATRLKRRSLVVLLTDFVDTVTAELMLENVQRLARRHLVIFVTLRDQALSTVAGAPPRSLTALHSAVVAEDFLREREIVIQRLRRLGVHCIDAPPEAVSMNLLNRYLDIKRRELV